MKVFVFLAAILACAYAIEDYDICTIGGNRPDVIVIDNCANTPCPMRNGEFITAYTRTIAGKECFFLLYNEDVLKRSEFLLK